MWSDCGLKPRPHRPRFAPPLPYMPLLMNPSYALTLRLVVIFAESKLTSESGFPGDPAVHSFLLTNSAHDMFHAHCATVYVPLSATACGAMVSMTGAIARICAEKSPFTRSRTNAFSQSVDHPHIRSPVCCGPRHPRHTSYLPSEHLPSTLVQIKPDSPTDSAASDPVVGLLEPVAVVLITRQPFYVGLRERLRKLVAKKNIAVRVCVCVCMPE